MNLILNCPIPFIISIFFFISRLFQKNSNSTWLSLAIYAILTNIIHNHWRSVNIPITFFLSSILLLTRYGVEDVRFTVNKLTCWFLLSICLNIISLNLSQSTLSGQLYMAFSLMIFAGIYPFAGWLDHFYIHSPVNLIAIFQLLIRPIICTICFLWFKTVIEYDTANRFLLIWLTIAAASTMFSSILLFTKKDFRRLLAYFSIIESGILLLICFNSNLSISAIFHTAFAQSAALLTLSIIGTHVYRSTQDDSLQNFSKSLANNKVCKIYFIIASLSLQIINIIAVSHIQNNTFATAYGIASVLIMLMITKKILEVKNHDNVQVVRLKLIDNAQLILLLCSTLTICKIF